MDCETGEHVKNFWEIDFKEKKKIPDMETQKLVEFYGFHENGVWPVL